jgi:hypothetical protein
VQATQDISFLVNGSSEDTQSGVTLNGSDTFDGTFTYQTQTSDTPAVTVGVSSGDDSADRTVTVNEPAVFTVTLTDVYRAVAETNDTVVDYTVENTGGAQDTQDITFAVNGTTEVTETNVTLNGSETFSGQFTYQTQVGDAPEVTVEVASDDDADSAVVLVAVESFELLADLTEEGGDVGDTVSVDMNVFGLMGANNATSSYQLGLSFNQSVLNFTNVSAGGWSEPFSVNEDNGTIAVAEFAASASTPLEPALTFNFEIVAEGPSDVAFDDDAVAGKSVIYDGGGNAYNTTFRDGAAGTGVSSSASRARSVESTAVVSMF